MDFFEISKQLKLSATSGEIYEIVMAFIKRENVLDATTRTWANNWLNYSPKDAKERACGNLITFKELIDKEVENHCFKYINENFSRNLPPKTTPIEFLFRNEDPEAYVYKEEHLASADIFSALMNSNYTDMALNKIFTQRWPEHVS